MIGDKSASCKLRVATGEQTAQTYEKGCYHSLTREERNFRRDAEASLRQFIGHELR
jgi:hypothetical protein